ncbi:MAG: GMC family oxidoreductase [Rhodothermales bacterium]
MHIIQSPKVYDVCIVGSGAGGGMAAKVLAEAGLQVVMLEAGRWWTSGDGSDMLQPNYTSPRRGRGTADRPFGEFDACLGGWEIEGEPYTRVEGTEWDWFRARMLGGRTHHWGRISLRFGPDDFRRRSIDGQGDDWPITYDDVAPYYDRVDDLVGIFGSRENFYNAPDGNFLPPPRPRAYELMVMDACEKMNIPVIPSRLSILTKPHNGRAACHFCAQCNRGCATHSNFSSPSVLLPPALDTGNLEVITNAMAREVLTDGNGKASGVSYIDTQTMLDYEVKAKAVVLAASACETARLLLNSKSATHPNGLANSSDVVGKYLTDSTGTTVAGYLPQLMDGIPHNQDGVGGMHVYIPWWLEKARTPFARGYHFEIWNNHGQPGYGFGFGIENYNGTFTASGQPNPRGGGGYGASLKADYRRLYGAMVGLSGRGEMIARKENYCEIDPEVVDRFGIPVLRFHVKWSDEEYLQVKHMQEVGRDIIQQLGGEPFGDMPTREQGYGILAPGRIIHEVGVVRMGDDPSTSAVNAYCQAHDCDNLFVADAAPFVSQAHKNPTWTILALSMRTSEYLIEQMRTDAI